MHHIFSIYRVINGPVQVRQLCSTHLSENPSIFIFQTLRIFHCHLSHPSRLPISPCPSSSPLSIANSNFEIVGRIDLGPHRNWQNWPHAHISPGTNQLHHTSRFAGISPRIRTIPKMTLSSSLLSPSSPFRLSESSAPVITSFPFEPHRWLSVRPPAPISTSECSAPTSSPVRGA